MENVMSTTFKFVFESAGGGSTPENVAAQTGDWLTMLLVALFAVAAVASLIFAFVKTKNSKNFASSAGHAAVKTATHTKTIVAVIIAALAIAGICFSVANAPALRAFANGNAEGVDFKPQITATVHEDTQTVTFEQNYFTNLEANPIHIDHSSLTLSDEAKSIIGEEEIYFEAKYVGEETRVFAGDADPSEDCKPVDQDALHNSHTQQIEYNTNITYEIAKKLCDIEEAFTLDLVPAECYTVDFSAEGADGGQPPHVQTITRQGQEGMEQTTIYAPGAGTLYKVDYEFVGWKDDEGKTYKEGDQINFTDNKTLTSEWKRVGSLSLSFLTEAGGNISKTSLNVMPNTLIKLEDKTSTGQTIYFGDTKTEENSVNATAETGYDFAKWVIVQGASETDVVSDTPVTSEMTFRAKFSVQKYTLNFEGVQGEGTVSKSSLSNIAYGTKIGLSGNDIYFGDTKTADNSVSPSPATKYNFKEWKYIKDESETDLPKTVTGAMTFRATFEKQTVKVSFKSEDETHGTVDAGTLAEVPVDTPYVIDGIGNITFDLPSPASDAIVKVNPAYKYGCTGWTINGDDAAISGNVTEESEFVAKFANNKYGITLLCDTSKGSITLNPEGFNDVDNNATFSISGTPATKGVLTFKWTGLDGTTQIATATPTPIDQYVQFKNWRVNGTDVTTLDTDFDIPGDGCTFELIFDEAHVDFIYKVMDVNHPHATITPNNEYAEENAELYTYTETITQKQIDQGADPKGATAAAKTIKYNNKYNYVYEFINWTKEGTGIVYDNENLVPNKETEGITEWKNVTYVCHVAAPRAVSSINSRGEEILTFVYDEELHSEAQNFNEGENFIFPVNNSHFSIASGETVLPSWWLDKYSSSINPKRVIFDPSFKNYKGLTSTSMWFMDSLAIDAAMEIMEDLFTQYNYKFGNSSNLLGDSKKEDSVVQRELLSVEGLNNVDTQNLEETALMFGSGYPMYASLEIMDKLKSVDLSSWNAPKLTGSMFGMFMGCSGLNTLKFPTAESGKQFGNLTEDLRGFFAYCVQLAEVPFSGSFGENAKDISFMFAYCIALSELKFSEPTTTFGKNVEFMPNAFARCRALKNIDLSNFSVSNFTTEQSYSKCIGGCEAIVKFTLEPNWNISVRDMGMSILYDPSDGYWYKFNAQTGKYDEYEERQIAAVSKGGTFTRNTAKAVYNVTKKELVFYYDHESHDGVEYIIPLGSMEGATSPIAPWYSCEIYINDEPSSWLSIYEGELDMFVNCKIAADIECLVPQAETVVFSNSFKDVENLRMLTGWFIGDSKGLQPYKNFYSEDKNGNRTPGFSNLNTSDVRYVSCMFGGLCLECYPYLDLYEQLDEMPNANFQSADTFGTGLTSLDLTTFDVDGNIDDYTGMFANASALTSVDLGASRSFSDRVDTSEMFYNCISLNSITGLGNFLQDWGWSAIRMFANCSSLPSLDLSSANTQSLYGDDCFGMFEGCASLKSIKLGSNWTLPMADCGLPDWSDHEASWYYVEQGTPEAVSVNDIPYYNGNTGNDPRLGRYEVTAELPSQEINVTVDPENKLSGVISPNPDTPTFNTSVSVKYVTSNNILIVNGRKYIATPTEGNKFKYWTIDDTIIEDQTFLNPVNETKFVPDTTITFKAVFGEEGLDAKAIYREGVDIDGKTVNTMTFVYDKQTYTPGADNIVHVFDVNPNTGLTMTTLFGITFPISAKYPDWIGGELKIDLNNGDFSFESYQKTDMQYVIFDSTFKDYSDLSSISMWFMADHQRKQTVEKFFSPGEDGIISQEVEGFANLNTSHLKNVEYAFGGAFTAEYLAPLFGGEVPIYNNPFDTYGNSIKELNMTDFDFSNLTSCSNMFANCIGLQKIIFNENIDTSNVAKMNGMFVNCENLGISDQSTAPIENIEKFDTSNVETMNYMFYGDCGLFELDLSGWNTEKVVTDRRDLTIGIHQNAQKMFTQCYRLNKIKTQTGIDMDKEVPFTGWSINLGLAGLEDTYNSDGEINAWNCDTTTEEDKLPSNQVPYNSQPQSLSDLNLLSGTFTRDAVVDCKITFEVNDANLGTVNGKESVSYPYIQDATVEYNSDIYDSLTVDNFRATASPIMQEGSALGNFVSWKFGEGFSSDLIGKTVPPDYLKTFYASDQEPGGEYKFVAFFNEASFTAKAVFKKNYQGNPDYGLLKFVYNDEEYDPAQYTVFEINAQNASSEFKLAPWYSDSGLAHFVSGDAHPIPYFNSAIDNISTKTVYVEFDDSFAYYDGLTSMSGWFMPAISRYNTDKAFAPFIFDSEHFKGLNNINTSNLNNVSYMFGGSEYTNLNNGSKVTSIDLTGFDTGKKDGDGDWIFEPNRLKNCSAMFANCVLLTDISFGDRGESLFGENCTNASKMFFNCKSLLGDDLNTVLSKIQWENVENISYMFAQYRFPSLPQDEPVCADNLIYKFPDNFVLRSLYSMDGMFSNVQDTKKITIEGGPNRTCSARSASYMFYGCKKLTTVNVDNCKWLQTSGVQDFSYAFANCSSLNDVSFIGKAFEGGQPYVILEIKFAKSLNNMFENCTSLENFNPGSRFIVYESMENADAMFKASGIKEFDFSSSEVSPFAYFNPKSMIEMFAECSSLEIFDANIAQPMQDNIMYATEAFKDCPNLTSVNLSNFRFFTAQSESQVDAYTNMFLLHHEDSSLDKLGNDVIDTLYFDDEFEWIRFSKTGIQVYQENGDYENWYYEDDPKLNPMSIEEVPRYWTGSEWVSAAGKFTKISPLKANFVPNINTWGYAQEFGSQSYEGQSCEVRYWEKIGLQKVENSNSLNFGVIKGLGDDQEFIRTGQIVPQTLAGSEFVNWTYINEEGSETPITTEGVMFDSDVEITANFANGERPQASYDDTTKTLTLYMGKVTPSETVWNIPFNGDISEEGQPWKEYASEIENIAWNFNEYDQFETFDNWFKNLTALTMFQGRFRIDKLASMNSMFEGCTNLQNAVFMSNYWGSYESLPSSISVDKLFKGCSNLNVFVDTIWDRGRKGIASNTSEMFSGCNNLSLIYSAGKGCNLDLSACGIPADKTWMISNASGKENRITDLQKISTANLKAYMGSSIYVSLIDENKLTFKTVDETKGLVGPVGGSYVAEYNLGFMDTNYGWKAKAKIDDLTTGQLIVTFQHYSDSSPYASSDLEFDIVVNYRPGEKSAFNAWYINEDKIEVAHQMFDLEIDDVVKIDWAQKKDSVAVFCDDEDNDAVLKFYYDTEDHSSEGDVIVCPDNNTKSTSPFSAYKNDVKTVEFDDSFADNIYLKSTSYWFFNFNKLQSVIDIENLPEDKISNYSYMFYGCSQLTNIGAIPQNDYTRSAYDINMQSMFCECQVLEELDLSNIKCEYISAYDMLYNCPSLKQITFGPNWPYNYDIYGYQSLYYMGLYDDNNSLWVDENFKSFNTWECPQCEVRSSGYGTYVKATNAINVQYNVEQGSTSLDTVPLISAYTVKLFVDTTSKDLKVGYFADDVKVNEITVVGTPRYDYDYKYELDGWMFDESALEVGQWVTIDEASDHVLAPKFVAATKLAKAVYTAGSENANATFKFYYMSEEDMPDGDASWDVPVELEYYSWTTNYPEWYWFLNNQQSFNIDVSFDASFKNFKSLKTMNNWFTELQYLNEVKDMNNIYTANIVGAAALFQGSSLRKVNLNGYQLTNPDMQNRSDCVRCMFNRCTQLTDLELGNFTASYSRDFTAFLGSCTSLTSVDVSGLDTSNANELAGFFEYCYSLETIKFEDDDGNTAWNTDKCGYFNSMFNGCSSLESLDFDSFRITGANVYSVYAEDLFRDCSSLKVLDFSTWNSEKIENHRNAFYALESLEYMKVGPKWQIIPRDWGLNDFMTDSNKNLYDGYSTTYESTFKIVETVDVVSNDTVAGVINNYAVFYFDSDLEYVKYTQNDEDNSITLSVYAIDGDVYIRDHTYYAALTGEIATCEFSGWTFDPEPEDGKITKKTKVTANFADSMIAAAYYNFDDERTLTFYYDNNEHTGVKFILNKNVPIRTDYVQSPELYVPWNGYIYEIEHVVFDESMKNCKGIQSMNYWFCNGVNIKSFEGFDNIDMSYCKQLESTFYRLGSSCEPKCEYNFSDLDTSMVETMDQTFFMAKANKLIFKKEDGTSKFNTNNVQIFRQTFYHIDTPSLDISNFTFGPNFKTCYDMLWLTDEWEIDLQSVDISGLSITEDMLYLNSFEYNGKKYDYAGAYELFYAADFLPQVKIGADFRVPFNRVMLNWEHWVYNGSADYYCWDYPPGAGTYTHYVESNENDLITSSAQSNNEQIDTVVPEEGSIEDTAAAAALLAAGPALAVLGMRKRLRGKHARLN